MTINNFQKVLKVFLKSLITEKSVGLFLFIFAGVLTGFCCTSAVIGAGASASGRPMLWKHRDTSTTDNKVEYVAAGDSTGYAYVALFNAEDKELKEAWVGMNEVGFAIMNTASYNIKDDKVPAKLMDKEGLVMTIALRTCRTMDDFEQLLRTLPRPMGIEANFGVIDALGNGGIFEANNHSYVKYDLKDSPGDVLIRTNYSHSGRPNEGYGHIREANAEHILSDGIANHDISAELLTETASRSFYHDVRGKDALKEGERWAVDEDFIPRYKSTATIVIEGIPPLSSIEEATPEIIVPQYIMWTGLGYPPVTDIYPVWCHPQGIDVGLRGLGPGGTSVIGNESKRRRGEVFPWRKGGNTKYIDLHILSNPEGTGYLQVLPPKNHEVYERISQRRDKGEIHFDLSKN